MATDMIQAALAAGRSALDEWESKRLFAAYGIPVPEGALVTSEAEAVDGRGQDRRQGGHEGRRLRDPSQDRGRPGGAWTGGGRRGRGRRDVPAARRASRGRSRSRARRADDRQQPRTHGRHEARCRLRSGGRVRAGRRAHRGARRRRPGGGADRRPRGERTARIDQGQAAARLLPRLSARGPGRVGENQSRPSGRWRSIIPRSPRSTSTRCWCRATGPWRPTR